MTAYFTSWSSNFIQMTVQFGSRPFSLAKDRSVLDGSSTFAFLFTFRTVHFHPFGVSTLDLTRFDSKHIFTIFSRFGTDSCFLPVAVKGLKY